MADDKWKYLTMRMKYQELPQNMNRPSSPWLRPATPSAWCSSSAANQTERYRPRGTLDQRQLPPPMGPPIWSDERGQPLPACPCGPRYHLPHASAHERAASPIERERAELPAHVANYERELDATPPENRE
jgi:hypothetical protein